MFETLNASSILMGNKYPYNGLCSELQTPSPSCSPDKCCVWRMDWGEYTFMCKDYKKRGEKCVGLNANECGCAPTLRCDLDTGKVRNIYSFVFK